MEIGAPGHIRRREIKIRIVQNDQSVFCRQAPERDLFEVAAGRLADLAAGACRAGKLDHRHVGVFAELCAGGAVSGNDLQHALRQAGQLKQTGR